MVDDVLSIENDPQLLTFMQLWMMSGAGVLSTIEQLAQSEKRIKLPELPGRDFISELNRLGTAMNAIITKLE